MELLLLNRGRPAGPRRGVIAGLCLAALMASTPGCGPRSEGRPAGSIHIENARTKAADVDAMKTKAKPTRARRP